MDRAERLRAEFVGYARLVRWDLVLGGYCIAVLAGLLFAFLIASAGNWNVGLDWERALLRRVHAFELDRGADILLLVVPWFGTNWTTLPIAVALATWLGGYRHRMDLAIPILVVQAGSNTLNALLKHLAYRERPDLWMKRGQFAWPSYPSGHAIATMSVLVFLTFLLVRERGVRWVTVLLVPLVAVVLYSRLYLGVHWPTDVVGGALVGLIWLVTVVRAFPARPATDVGRTGGA